MSSSVAIILVYFHKNYLIDFNIMYGGADGTQIQHVFPIATATDAGALPVPMVCIKNLFVNFMDLGLGVAIE